MLDESDAYRDNAVLTQMDIVSERIRSIISNTRVYYPSVITAESIELMKRQLADMNVQIGRVHQNGNELRMEVIAPVPLEYVDVTFNTAVGLDANVPADGIYRYAPHNVTHHIQDKYFEMP